MELTSNFDILRLAREGAKFFVNGLEMEFRLDERNRRRCYLQAHRVQNDIGYSWVHVRVKEPGVLFGRALFDSREELIQVIKSGEFTVS